MKVSYNWLSQYVDIDVSPEKAAELLTLAGLEIDEIESFGHRLDGVVVGKVTECEEHPNADRLWLCQVDIGEEKAQIVCGADNVEEGQRVPVATVGTTLPVRDENGEEVVIREAKLRGKKSRGMICSEVELGLGEDHEGIMVLQNSNAEPGTTLREALQLETDTVYDIELTPNRPDASCHIGVARDLSAVLEQPLETPYKDENELPEAEPLEGIDIEIKNPDRCNRYVAKMVDEVTVAPSPQWLKNRLKSIGVQPINNIVDITNYILHEIGQPLHAFDYDQIRGNKIVVQEYGEERKFTTLDGVERTLDGDALFICDAEGPIALAGIMGGQNSEIGPNTKTVLIESAHFTPPGIRRTSKAQNLQTDSSYRFERGIDPNMARTVAEQAARLIAELGNGTVREGCTDAYPVKTSPIDIELNIEYLNRLLGTDFDVDEAVDILHQLEIEVISSSAGALTCRIPTFRPDITREVDLVEEIGRIFDYNNIPSPDYVKFPKPRPRGSYEQLEERVKNAVRSLRFKEIYTNSLLPEPKALLFADESKLIHTLNPVSRDMAVLRPSLAHGFLHSTSYNFNRKVHSVRFFELGQVFERNADGQGTYHRDIEEQTQLLMGISGYKTGEHWRTDPEKFDFFDLKKHVEPLLKQLNVLSHIRQERSGQALQYKYDNRVLAELYKVDEEVLKAYEIDQPTYLAEISLTLIDQLQSEQEEPSYQPVSKFPTFEFDLDLVVDNPVPAADLMDSIRETAGELLQDIQIFDVFEGESLGEGKKSLAFRLTFLDRTQTLTIDDVQPIINKIVNELEEQYSAELRS